jgi:hypothetical protein
MWVAWWMPFGRESLEYAAVWRAYAVWRACGGGAEAALDAYRVHGVRRRVRRVRRRVRRVPRVCVACGVVCVSCLVVDAVLMISREEGGGREEQPRVPVLLRLAHLGEERRVRVHPLVIDVHAVPWRCTQRDAPSAGGGN